MKNSRLLPSYIVPVKEIIPDGLRIIHAESVTRTQTNEKNGSL